MTSLQQFPEMSTVEGTRREQRVATAIALNDSATWFSSWWTSQTEGKTQARLLSSRVVLSINNDRKEQTSYHGKNDLAESDSAHGILPSAALPHHTAHLAHSCLTTTFPPHFCPITPEGNNLPAATSQSVSASAAVSSCIWKRYCQDAGVLPGCISPVIIDDSRCESYW